MIGVEAVRAAAFRWMPRMLNTDGWTCMEVDGAGNPALWAADGGGWVESLSCKTDAIPDGDDPATRGCFLELVREAYSDPTIHLVPRPGRDGAALWGMARLGPGGAPIPVMALLYENEFKLLVVALCAAPESEVG